MSPFAQSPHDNSTRDTELTSSQYSISVLSILIVVALGIIVGYLVQLLRLPSLLGNMKIDANELRLGMLLMGIALRNIPWTGAAMFIVKDWGKTRISNTGYDPFLQVSFSEKRPSSSFCFVADSP